MSGPSLLSLTLSARATCAGRVSVVSTLIHYIVDKKLQKEKHQSGPLVILLEDFLLFI